MRHTIFIRLAILCALALATLGGCAFVEKIDKLTIADIDPGRVKDGTYTGSVRILPVTASVRVTVSAGRITDIALLSHSHGRTTGPTTFSPGCLPRRVSRSMPWPDPPIPARLSERRSSSP